VIDLESQLNLRSDAEAVVSLVMEHQGAIACDIADRATYWLSLRPSKAPEETFIARVAWDRYPHDPPSVKFATAIGGELVVSFAWPIIGGYRPGSFDICQPFTKEAYEIHPEWKNGPERWRPTGNPFFWVAEILQRDLDTRYEGRSG
jgi:hypothetical protein